MEKLDLAKRFRAYYSAGPKPALKQLEACTYISISGKGDPSGQAFQENLQALYSVVYNLKFAYKAMGNDFVVAKLEGLWNFDTQKFKITSLAEAPLKVPRSEWNYRMLIRLPDFVNQEQLDKAKIRVMAKKGLELVKKVELFSLPVRTVVEMMHLGAFDDEYQSLLQIQEFIQEKQLLPDGLHQEVYLSNFNTTEPSKLKTILREPVKES